MTTPALRTLHQRAYEVAGIVSDCRYIASTLSDVIPDSIHEVRVDDIGRLEGLASAVERLMKSAAENLTHPAPPRAGLFIAGVEPRPPDRPPRARVALPHGLL